MHSSSSVPVTSDRYLALLYHQSSIVGLLFRERDRESRLRVSFVQSTVRDTPLSDVLLPALRPTSVLARRGTMYSRRVPGRVALKDLPHASQPCLCPCIASHILRSQRSGPTQSARNDQCLTPIGKEGRRPGVSIKRRASGTGSWWNSVRHARSWRAFHHTAVPTKNVSPGLQVLAVADGNLYWSTAVRGMFSVRHAFTGMRGLDPRLVGRVCLPSVNVWWSFRLISPAMAVCVLNAARPQ